MQVFIKGKGVFSQWKTDHRSFTLSVTICRHYVKNSPLKRVKERPIKNPLADKLPPINNVYFVTVCNSFYYDATTFLLPSPFYF